MASRSASWAEHICHPVALAAVVVLAANDHLLKGSGLLHTAIAGKLSDVAGLFFFPLLVSAGIRGVRLLLVDDENDHPAISLAAVAATGAGFTALKTWPGFNAAISCVLGANTLDVTDLWALPALIPSWLWMRRRSTRRLSNRLHLAAVAVSALASMATSRARGNYVRNYPAWTIDSARTHDLPCGTAEAWVLKSGKQGTGIVVEVTASKSDCRVQVQSARLDLKSGSVASSTPPSPVAIEAGGPARDLYLPFLFDGNAAWNHGDREATVHLVLLVNDEAERWELHLRNDLQGGMYVFRPEEAARP